MPHNQKLINDILALSKRCDNELYAKITELLEKYYTQTQECQKLQKQNEFFLQKWDRRNILDHEREAKKDQMLEQQSRLAAMGEMIDAVAHQWKQPLNSISMLIDMLKIDFIDGEVDENYMDEFSESIHFQIDHMVTTLSEFRDFLRPSTKNQEFYFQEILNHVQILMKDELISQNLHLHIDIDETIKIFGNKNEFIHLFINLINNSIDAFNERHIKKRESSIFAAIWRIGISTLSSKIMPEVSRARSYAMFSNPISPPSQKAKEPASASICLHRSLKRTTEASMFTTLPRALSLQLLYIQKLFNPALFALL